MNTQKEIMRLAEENSKTYFAHQEPCGRKYCYLPTHCPNAEHIEGIFHCGTELDKTDLEESYYWYVT